jgi:heme/copper-type cytochrome/quinol oxidase subunit 2
MEYMYYSSDNDFINYSMIAILTIMIIVSLIGIGGVVVRDCKDAYADYKKQRKRNRR